jgi:hypothetical protein
MHMSIEHEAVLGFHYSLAQGMRNNLAYFPKQAYTVAAFMPPLDQEAINCVERLVETDDMIEPYQPDAPIVQTKQVEPGEEESPEFSAIFLQCKDVESAEEVKIAIDGVEKILQSLKDNGTPVSEPTIKMLGWNIRIFDSSNTEKIT